MIEAVDECIKDDVLSDFFIKHRDEVIDVSIFEYDEEKILQYMLAVLQERHVWNH